MTSDIQTSIPWNLPNPYPPHVPNGYPASCGSIAFGLDPNPNHTAALLAHAAALNRIAVAMEKANERQERRNPSVFA